MRQFFDIESRETITESQLYSEYIENMKSGNYANVTFAEYVNNCLTINNGALEAIQNA